MKEETLLWVLGGIGYFINNFIIWLFTKGFSQKKAETADILMRAVTEGIETIEKSNERVKADFKRQLADIEHKFDLKEKEYLLRIENLEMENKNLILSLKNKVLENDKLQIELENLKGGAAIRKMNA